MHESPVGHDLAIPGREGQWFKMARGQRMVIVSWQDGASVLHVEGTVSCENVERTFALHLTEDTDYSDSKTLVWDGIDVTVTLTRATHFAHLDGQIVLICNVPLTVNSFFNAPIAAWQAWPHPQPDIDPGEDTVETGIEGPHQAVDLFPFVWLHPPGLRELIDIDRSYIRLKSLGLEPQQLALYNELVLCTGSGAATDKRTEANNFRTSGYLTASFVSALSALPAPLSQFPLWCAELERIPHTIPNIELEEMAFLVLGQRPSEFLKDRSWMEAQSNIWQTLFALALVGTAADAKLAIQLTDVLRIGHFLQLLASHFYDDLGEQRVRHLVLGARPVFPNPVAAFPPAPGISGPPGGAAGGSWEVLGVGTLKMARQRLCAYLPGELAEVVNVMPRERQEVQERYAASSSDSTANTSEHETQNQAARLSSATNEMTDAVQEAMAAEGMLRNLNNIQPAYNNLNLTLSGAGADGKADSKWSGQDASRYLQQLTEQAARQLGERVSRQRGSVWQEFRERRQSNLIDNTGNGRLVGVYRWIDRLMRVHLEEAGRRLVLSFLVDQPAAAWLAKIQGAEALPLQQPQPLAMFSVADSQGYTTITALNYQSYGAQYGLSDMPPPPPAALAVSASYDRVGAAELTGLRIPDGYVADTGQLTIGLADQRYNLQCSVAGQAFSSPAVLPQAVLNTVVPVSDATATTIPDAIVQPPVMPTATVTYNVMTGIKGASGPVPVTLMTAAPAFVVKVDIQCIRNSAVAIDQEMTSWQIRTYERLLQAYRTASRNYAEQLALRIAAASAGHTGEVQRNALRQSCLELLAPGGAADPQQYRFLDPLFSWAAMSWHYEPWHASASGAWPERTPGEKSQPKSEHLFELFLRAPSARVLLPVEPGCEAWLLFYLQYGLQWVGGPGSEPVTSSCVLLLEEIHAPERLRMRNRAGHFEPVPALLKPDCPRSWTVRVPTSMLYLQDDASLPHFHEHDRSPLPLDPGTGSAP